MTAQIRVQISVVSGVLIPESIAAMKIAVTRLVGKLVDDSLWF